MAELKQILNHNTVYVSAADKDGNMVSLIQSNYMGCGSGVVIPNTGISMNNRGACFSLSKTSPNFIQPDKRPYHTIIPGLMTYAGKAYCSFGVMGGYF